MRLLVGDPVRVVWSGYKVLKPASETDDGRVHRMKLFEVFVVDGERAPIEELPGHVKQ